MRSARLAGTAIGVLAVAGTNAIASEIEVIYSKKAGHPTANIPGTLDLSGQPVMSDWRAIEDFSVSPSGHRWMLKGRTQLGSDLETIMLLGRAVAGDAFAQEGQPFLGASPGELYDFFDTPSPASFDTLGNIVFSARAKGAPTADDEKLIHVSAAGVHTLILQQGDPALGLADVPANPADDEVIGNSIGSVQALETPARAQFVNTPIGNLHTSRYPAMFRGNTAFRQSGVSLIGGEVWDSFDLSDAGGTPDGLHWFAEGDTENPNTAVDDILAVDDVVVLREGSPVAGAGSPIYADIFQTQMAENGTWISRGDDPTDADWAVLNGNLIARTGDSITTGAGEHWGDIFLSIACNRHGDWVIVGNTDSGNLATDTVLVLNGTHVLAREGDPVDLNGNGAFDDDAFIGRGNNTLSAFAPFDVHVSDGRVVYAIVQLRDEAGNDLNSNPVFGTPDAFVRIRFCPGDLNRDLAVDLADLALILGNFGACEGGPGYTGGYDTDGSGCIDLADLAQILATFGSGC
jgi:hypothetical protein